MSIFPTVSLTDLQQIAIAVVLIITGGLVGFFLSRMLLRALRALDLDGLSSRANVQQAFEKMGFKSTSSLLANYFFWALLMLSISYGLRLIEMAALLKPLSDILAGLVIATGIMVACIFLMEILITLLRKLFAEIGLTFASVDRALEKTGLKTLDIMYIIIRFFVILAFLEFALWFLRIDPIIAYVEPLLELIPRIMVITLLILIGIALVELLIKIIFGILDTTGITRLIDVVAPLPQCLREAEVQPHLFFSLQEGEREVR
jgi:hypothetical protein